MRKFRSPRTRFWARRAAWTPTSASRTRSFRRPGWPKSAASAPRSFVITWSSTPRAATWDSWANRGSTSCSSTERSTSIRGRPRRNPRRGHRMPIRSDEDSESPTREASEHEGDAFDPDLPLAVFLVGGKEALGTLAFDRFVSLYVREFPQILFLSIGIMDQSVVDGGVDGSGNFEGTREAQRLRKRTRENLRLYLEGARKLGLKVSCRVSVSVDTAEEIARLSDGLSAAYPKAVYFLGKLVF